MKNSFQERRRYPRLKKNIPVKICGDEFDIVTDTYNLSCVGAYCRVNKYIEPMTKLKIHLLLPLKRRNKVMTKKVSCQGVVVRTESQSGNDYFNIAIYFNEIQQKDIKNISDYVNTSIADKEQQPSRPA